MYTKIKSIWSYILYNVTVVFVIINPVKILTYSLFVVVLHLTPVYVTHTFGAEICKVLL